VSLHRLTEITLGVPNVADTVEYYAQLGLTLQEPAPGAPEYLFSTVDGGQQLRIVQRPLRKLVSLGVGVDDADDLIRIAASLDGLGLPAQLDGGQLSTVEPVSGLDVVVSIAARVQQLSTPAPHNSPGNIERPNVRAPGVLRTEPVRPRKLGHVVIASTDRERSVRFFISGLGFKLSDEVKGLATFMRCSPDHHNVLIQAGPTNFMHHTAWEVEDVDEIGRGAQTLLEGHPERHIWGFGRHMLGSNYYHYLRDPAGNITEYYSDMDEILDDQIWEPGLFEVTGGDAWGPPTPISMVEPDDLAELVAGAPLF
jgi:catechol 2,3-dioxygenase-like lactoylglutathione lyase family enzyme